MRLRSTLMAAAVLGAAATCAAADEAVLTTGRTLSIEGCRREGDVVWLSLEGGGALAVPAARVREVRPSPPAATPEADPAAPGADAAAPAAEPATSEVDAQAAIDLDRLIDAAAARHGVSPRLLRAVIAAESSWDLRAVSPKGASGLMQLMPPTAEARGVTDPFDPAQNVDAGAAELADDLQRYAGELSLALAAYNAGPGAVSRYDGIPPYRETLTYVRRVLDQYFPEPLPPPPALQR